MQKASLLLVGIHTGWCKLYHFIVHLMDSQVFLFLHGDLALRPSSDMRMVPMHKSDTDTSHNTPFNNNRTHHSTLPQFVRMAH
ncbi:hypothetical protein SERLA73DRAFT_186831 [Serpula lacrymans var. lacrymans S7.3]|uniref:Uncharacterized protein n=2 Tax=Serpula lacrymans var. lacrymans TaxID=341189 RepID=F8Q7Y2_SERL3|nr:uncharacterized protein SERLADRAFT_476080 [Serpula lacrymans var. lacrymans S7.9]EGN95670.1 hypothetical protein SERLA73DRAFT_186831 [Serpula lacrymans var. lacrymans S7.3]EGO21197.1 hypothetical protein SERLADRAFT_476080 [Serpula lacrymans var. lacrymans S7.9]